MSEYLTPEQVEHYAKWQAAETGIAPHIQADVLAATLREYAAIVEGIASFEDPGWWHGLGECPFCDMHQHFDVEADCYQHAPNCLWLRARRVRGLAERGE